MFQSDKISQVAKYQVSHTYDLNYNDLEEGEKEKQLISSNCTVELSEYLIHYTTLTSVESSIKLIGKKQMLLSDIAQFKRERTFDKLFILPYFDNKGKIKGSQLVLNEDNQIIKITDQDKNRIFHHETDLVQFGQ